MHLYLDTSHFLALGLLDENFKWLHYEFHQKLQHSGDIHAQIHELLEKHQLETSKLNSLIVCNGPGSYTGIRLGEGIAQLFELAGIPVFAFHQFEVPYLLGTNSGAWVCHGFKREVFQYCWDDEQTEMDLIAADEWHAPKERPIFTHQPEGPWQEATPTFTTELVKERSVELFSTIVAKKWRREPYYFRPLDKEFKRSVE